MHSTHLDPEGALTKYQEREGRGGSILVNLVRRRGKGGHVCASQKGEDVSTDP